MIIFGICLMALCIGSAVGYVATTRGRSFVPWAIYGTVLGPVALPHVLLARDLSTEQAWSPIRYGLPSGNRTCPYCEAPVHEDAIACRRCRRPFYGVASDSHGFAGTREAGEGGDEDDLAEVTGAFAALEKAIARRHASAAAADRRRETARDRGWQAPEEPARTREEPVRGEASRQERPRQERSREEALREEALQREQPRQETRREPPRAEPDAPAPARPEPRAPEMPDTGRTAVNDRAEPSLEDDWPLDEKDDRRSEPQAAPVSPAARSTGPGRERRENEPPEAHPAPQYVQFRVAPKAQPRRNTTVAQTREQNREQEQRRPGRAREAAAARPRSRWTTVGVAPSASATESGAVRGNEAPATAWAAGQAGDRAQVAEPPAARHEQLRADPVGGDHRRRAVGRGRGVAVFATAVAAGILLALLTGAVTLWTNPQIMPVMASIPFVDAEPTPTIDVGLPPGAETSDVPETPPEWSLGSGDERDRTAGTDPAPQEVEATGRPIEIAPRFLPDAAGSGSDAPAAPAPPPPPAPSQGPSADTTIVAKGMPDAPPRRLGRREAGDADAGPSPIPPSPIPPAPVTGGAEASEESAAVASTAAVAPETQTPPPQEDLIARVIAALNERANARKAAEAVAQGRSVTEITASGDLIATVQRELQARGLEPGPVDGRVGPRTREAVRAFQQRMGLAPTGEIDRTVLVQLGLL